MILDGSYLNKTHYQVVHPENRNINNLAKHPSKSTFKGRLTALFNKRIDTFVTMQQLQFPSYEFRFKSNENKPMIFDLIRKKFVVLTPEEWVRQHVLHFLISEKNYPASLINVEKQIKLNKTTKRYDVVVFNRDGSIQLIVECKAPKIKITQDTFDQIARYNFVLEAENLMITNGLSHYYCRMDFDNERYIFLEDLPAYLEEQ